MHLVVKFKGLDHKNRYLWERVDDALPKQLVTETCPSFQKNRFPKVNQLYIIHFSRIEGQNLINYSHIDDYFVNCKYWKVVGSDLEFKRDKNKGMLVSEYAACFLYNVEEEMSFIKSLSAIYHSSYNVYTRNNVLRIFNSGYITRCDVFGDSKGSVLLVGKKGYLGVDIAKITKYDYQRIRNRLTWFIRETLNPVTKINCEKWVKYLDGKFQKQI